MDLALGPLDPVERALADLGQMGAGKALDRVVGGSVLKQSCRRAMRGRRSSGLAWLRSSSVQAR